MDKAFEGLRRLGGFRQATQEVAKVFGESPALKGLRQGEAHGLNDYTDAFDDEHVIPKGMERIRGDPPPQTRRRLDPLKGLDVAR